MGESAQEKAAGEQRNMLNMRASQYGAGGSEGYLARYAQVDPYFSKAISDMSQGMGAYLGSLRSSTGGQLIEGGVAPGSNINSSFIGAVAPAIAEFQGKMADINMKRGGSLMELMGQSDRTMAQLLGLSTQSIGGMKDSTVFGDIMGGLGYAANVAGGLVGLGGLFRQGTGGGGGGTQMAGPTGLEFGD